MVAEAITYYVHRFAQNSQVLCSDICFAYFPQATLFKCYNNKQYMLNIHLASLYLIQLAKFWNNLDSKNWTEHDDHLIRIIEVCICAYVCMYVCMYYILSNQYSVVAK